jgi:hypothetical protein
MGKGLTMISEELRNEIVEAVATADVCCEEQVCDMVLAAAGRGDDWQAVLAECKDRDAVERQSLGVANDYRFATDSETGTIEAVDFADACEQLRDMLPDATVADGAWGWVENTDGKRYKIGC